MTSLGLVSKWDVAAFVECISVEDYFEGPVPDDNPRFDGEVWKFGPYIEGCQFYVKQKITEDPRVLCISFHPAEFPIQYPYR